MKTTVSKNSEVILLSALIALIVAYRIYILNVFGFVYTDSDQTIMWMSTKDFSQGFFHEPRFYGQDYNTMLEGLLAVPFLKAGLPVFISLPIVTSILALFPFFLISLLTYFYKSKIAGVIILAVPLLLPVEYEMLTCLPRGFVTGVAVASLCCIPLFSPLSSRAFFTAGLAAIIGYSVNANSILFSVPCFFLLLLHHFRNRNFYLFSGAGFLTGLALHLVIAWFYLNHANYILHSFQPDFSFKNLWSGLKELDYFFAYITPIFKKQGWMILVFFTIISLVLFKQKKIKEGITVLLILPLILLPFSASKVHDGTTSVFFSYARMYLAVPVFLALIVSFFKINKTFWTYGFLLTVIVFYSFKIKNTPQAIAAGLKKNHVIAIIKNKELLAECRKISAVSIGNKIELIIINNHWYYDIYNYGCPACIDRFPKTLKPQYERRIWRLEEDETAVYKNILLIDVKRKLNEEFEFISQVDGMPGFYLVKENNLPTMELMRKLKIEVRNY